MEGESVLTVFGTVFEKALFSISIAYLKSNTILHLFFHQAKREVAQMATQGVIVRRANNLWMKSRLKKRPGTVWEEVKGSRRYGTNTRKEFLSIWEEQNTCLEQLNQRRWASHEFVYVQGCKQTFKILVSPQLHELVCPRGWFLFNFITIIILLYYNHHLNFSSRLNHLVMLF